MAIQVPRENVSNLNDILQQRGKMEGEGWREKEGGSRMEGKDGGRRWREKMEGEGGREKMEGEGWRRERRSVCGECRRERERVGERGRSGVHVA